MCALGLSAGRPLPRLIEIQSRLDIRRADNESVGARRDCAECGQPRGGSLLQRRMLDRRFDPDDLEEEHGRDCTADREKLPAHRVADRIGEVSKCEEREQSPGRERELPAGSGAADLLGLDERRHTGVIDPGEAENEKSQS